MKTVIINGKKYDVDYVFNMVGNYEFTDKHGAVHLVDAEDVAEWAERQATPSLPRKYGIAEAIDYARYYSDETEDGIFWWKVKKVL